MAATDRYGSGSIGWRCITGLTPRSVQHTDDLTLKMTLLVPWHATDIFLARRLSLLASLHGLVAPVEQLLGLKGIMCSG